MEPLALIAAVSIFTAGLTIAIGGYGSSRGEGEALAKAIEAVSRQPESANEITRLFFIGAAIVESVAIYALVIALIILFANPFLGLFVK
ncbi:ATP synthase F0 subunit C [bacterium (Candidatus Blackallbacteria) CG17_big_fil_post_rev_8_21_14_2_50_48_46]|uniref:ATP synthase subunit c n=1 Tax=bacterium (Candidatus Blackallbacteria) CG17_big_fil_post_rev_8_21_14_2_50_48_46 TaxID=2014261 RepID=A0A2M7G0X1_9BACT|nr:MAG: ATP synthase F0 subunit C [bacterium (Candidatus Blackallbacteria) CG18_big_fil_WC_8_21_14_2_50_49_26]PIW15358.1 MAG: ATP synthase F0 subunit C [bacterium (Candidatus Blackallbacteria) CG17_big_fil_post_rev_8_21_14_2_50_48_46]PIW49781.1 MAG: ATP synthase F0 subunit C [bacterium (Candidatus Blackallbacteria) CG13_big_fil_rev_8_21_14_2_50_49_14]